MSSLAFGFGAVFTVGGLAAALIGTSQIHEQHRILTSAGRTIGVVRRSAIVSRPVMLSDKRCIAVVEFDYVVNGQHYTGTSAELRQEWTTFDRSREIVMATRRGKPATVFYDRQRPSTAYLFPRHSLFPYLIVLAGLGSLALGVGVLLMGGVRSRPALAAARGTTLIHPSTTMGHVAKSLGWSGLILQVGGVITLGHYFLVSESPEIGAWVWGGTFEVPCLAVLGLFVYYYLTANRIGDALIIIPSRTVLGSPLPIRISQLVRRDLFLESLAVELVRVIKVAGHGKGRVDEQVVARQEVFRNREAYRGETLHGEVTLVLPPANDAGADDPAMHHERSWEVRVHAHIRRSPDYLGVFPITAHTSTPDTRD